MNKNNLAEAIFKYYVIKSTTLSIYEKETIDLINQFSETQIFEVLDYFVGDVIDYVDIEEILFYLIIVNNPTNEDLYSFVDDYKVNKENEIYYYNITLHKIPDENIEFPLEYKLFNNIIVTIKY